MSFCKVSWPTEWTQGHPDFCSTNLPVFLLTVDGIHCRIEEPQHPTKSKDRSYYSHKFKTAGVDYEIGSSVYDNRLVWMNGPMRASRHDITVFRRAGLQAMILKQTFKCLEEGFRHSLKYHQRVFEAANLRDLPIPDC